MWQSPATDHRLIWFSEGRAGSTAEPPCSAQGSIVIYRPQAENRRRRDAGHPRSAASRRRQEDSAGADAEAAAERRRLRRVTVVSQRRAEGSCCNTACIDRKILHIWRPSASPVLLLVPPCTADGAYKGIKPEASLQRTDGMN